MNAAAIRRSWSSSTRISTPLGVGENGVFGIDLVRDGPHGLVGGTTGSGKSEFLRSMVAGLAAGTTRRGSTFILIDFKGGAAFKTCERLPHTIGTVSNLDEQLADRALTALEAELRYRQEVFARAGEGVDNLDAYLATKPEVPMPRLLLVVDEFAMLAKDYPDVLKSLVSVAAVGRTLGVHMILATQRPAGVVSEDILANTNLRVALRVQSRDDSNNVIGVPDAAAIGRTQWGRAYVKLGQDDISPVQTALVTGRAETQTSQLVDLHPVHFGHDEQRDTSTNERDDEATDLDLLIDAIVEANHELGFGAPRPVWPEPLGTRVALTVAGEQPVEGQASAGRVRGSVVEIAVADDPRRQLQRPVGWDLDRGNLLVLGIPGSGTTTTLSSIALTLADTYAPEDLDLMVLDLGTRELAPLGDLPHTAAYVGAGSGTREQQVRFLKLIRTELDRRRSAPGPHRTMIILIDGLGVLKDEYDDFEGLKLLDGLYRVFSDGPDVSMWTAITTSRSKAVPSAVEEVATQRWLFRLADPYDYSISGVPTKLAPPPIPGRCVLAETKLHAHVATADGTLPETVAMITKRWGDVAPKPQVVGQLPTSVTVAELGAAARMDAEPWHLPVGIRESDLGVAELEVFEGEHVMICGPARSGKSTLLLAVDELVRAQGATVWGVCGRRSPLPQAGLDRCAVGEEEATALLAAARVHNGRLVLLVDDAEQFADNDQAFAGLLAAKTTDLLVVAAGRSDDLRTMYSHWTKTVPQGPLRRAAPAEHRLRRRAARRHAAPARTRGAHARPRVRDVERLDRAAPGRRARLSRRERRLGPGRSAAVPAGARGLRRRDRRRLPGLPAGDRRSGGRGRTVRAAVQPRPDDVGQAVVPVDDVPLRLGDEAGAGARPGRADDPRRVRGGPGQRLPQPLRPRPLPGPRGLAAAARQLARTRAVGPRARHRL